MPATDAVSPERAPLKLAAFLPYRLNVAAAIVSDGLARIYSRRFGIGVPEWRVLATMGEFQSITGKAIGLHSHMGKVKVSRAVASLEARGLIRRSPNEDDMREAFLVLTPEGARLYGEIAPLALAYVKRLESTLSPSELETLNAVLEKLMRRTQELDDPPA